MIVNKPVLESETNWCVYCTENIRVFITLSRKLIFIFKSLKKPFLPNQIPRI